MFEVKTTIAGHSYYIGKGSCEYLHSDGNIYSTVEYLPTEKDAQKVLDKFQPKPKHEWKHGDVFEYNCYIMIFLIVFSKRCVYYLSRGWDVNGELENYLKDGKFLFNIKEKI